MEKIINLSDEQILFLKIAVNLKESVMPLNPSQLNPKTFKEDYGVSQKKMLMELKKLQKKLDKINL